MRRSPHPDDRGVVAIEFLLVAPFLLALIFAAVVFGGMKGAQTELTGAVRDGARAATLGQSPQAKAQASFSRGTFTTFSGHTCTANEIANGTGQGTASATFNFPVSFPGYSGTRTLSASGSMPCGG